MNHSGDAAEQIVRMSLEGVEVAAKITGGAAKEVALMLLAALKSPEQGRTDGLKLKGRERLNSMLKSGKALEIFSVRERDLRAFVREAKRYGVVYCVLRDKNNPDGLCDVMARAEDAPKINRIVERFNFATVETAAVESEPVQAAQTVETQTEINDVETLLDDLLGASKTEREVPLTEGGELENPINPPPPLPPQSKNPSKRSSNISGKSERTTSTKPSVKDELAEITAAQKARDAVKPPVAPTPAHKQPQKKRKKSKGR